MLGYLFLFLAIVIEVYASIQLKHSNGLKFIVPSLLTFFGYGLAFFFLARSLIYLPMSIVFATWSGLGIASTVLFSLFFLNERVSKQSIVALTILLSGIILLNSSS
ncbi:MULTISPECIES: DMT family transporter [Shouchella]|uniref:Multidrug efflux SMR transporter n=2 Tax=Shouchella TaxID=2893057 RepID=A0ABY7W752_9BACI|nr:MULTISPECIES: multidrug efflux SMR transporter [Shouchella]MED4130710.1 multidrug efflux SMR transporter [Shouchella miscanthi]WDF03298.1 multidrug efflux SMR transporter [Shouchella hunanensis]